MRRSREPANPSLLRFRGSDDGVRLDLGDDAQRQHVRKILGQRGIGRCDPVAPLASNGVTTHSFDSGQRLVDLEVTARDTGPLAVTVTANRNLAPPGWYMLFLVNQDGIPSTANWVHLT